MVLWDWNRRLRVVFIKHNHLSLIQKSMFAAQCFSGVIADLWGGVLAARVTFVSLQVLLVQGVFDWQVGEEALVLLLQLSDLAEQILSFSPPHVLHQLQLLDSHIALCYWLLTGAEFWTSQNPLGVKLPHRKWVTGVQPTSCPVGNHLLRSSISYKIFLRGFYDKKFQNQLNWGHFLHSKMLLLFPPHIRSFLQPRLPHRRLDSAVAAQTTQLLSDLATESQSQETYCSTIFIAEHRGVWVVTLIYTWCHIQSSRWQ